jgi:hypothetical protein
MNDLWIHHRYILMSLWLNKWLSSSNAGYVPFVVTLPGPFLVNDLSPVPLVEQWLATLPEHLSSPQTFIGVRFTRSLVLCVLLYLYVSLHVLRPSPPIIALIPLCVAPRPDAEPTNHYSYTSLVEQWLATLPEHLSSPQTFIGVRFTRSLVLCAIYKQDNIDLLC